MTENPYKYYSLTCNGDVVEINRVGLDGKSISFIGGLTIAGVEVTEKKIIPNNFTIF